ncbi:MAG: hypothetical protein ACUVXA_11190 [Candidatus Jordarchaeum sp.]|uniref:hypothetical protein n=1 Tax=Candidatus Jordarchaeum sp. TaxID=2823881 RepID=UPI004049510C
MSRPAGVTILAILMILWGILVTIFGVIVLAAAGFTLPWESGLVLILPIIYTIWGIIYLIGGIGMLSLKNWARILAIIIAILGLIGGILLLITIVGIIFGIIYIVFSIIIIWYLSQEEVKAYFE